MRLRHTRKVHLILQLPPLCRRNVVVLLQCDRVPRNLCNALQWQILWEVIHQIRHVVEYWDKAVIVRGNLRHEVLVNVCARL